MFLANDSKEHRESKIRRFLTTEPGISLLLAAVNFEWTVCRAVLFLSKRPNSELRLLMASYYSLDAYKEFGDRRLSLEAISIPWLSLSAIGHLYAKRSTQGIGLSTAEIASPRTWQRHI